MRAGGETIRRRLPEVYLITDRHQTHGRPLVAVVEAALRGGVDAVQLREKDLAPREQFELACALREVCARYGALLLVNDRADIAATARAHGVHLPARSFSPTEARSILGDEAVIGSSCHSLAEAQAASHLGADFLVCGPIFPTPAKLAYGPPLGVETLALVCAAVPCPVLGIGGITAAHVQRIRAAGAAGIAVIRAILAAPDPERAAAELRAAWEAAH